MSLKSSNEPTHLPCIRAQTGCRGAQLCILGDCSTRPQSLLTLKRGDRIPAQNGTRNHFSVVQRGLVATCAMTPDGRRQILFLNFPGDAIYSMSGEDAGYWSESLTESMICQLDLPAESGRLARDPELSGVLLDLAHERLERTAAHLVGLGRFDGMERVCGFLAEMIQRTGRRRGNGWRINLPMSREDIADYLGLNCDTVGRLLKRIKQEGLAQFLSPTECDIACLDRLEAHVPISFARGGSGPFRAKAEPAS